MNDGNDDTELLHVLQFNDKNATASTLNQVLIPDGHPLAFDRTSKCEAKA